MISNIRAPTVCQSSSGDSKEKKETSPAALRLVELEKECLCLLYLLCKGSLGSPEEGCVAGEMLQGRAL